MLPTFWHDQYLILLNLLIDIKNLLDSQALEPNTLKNGFKNLTKHFYTQILPITGDEISLVSKQSWQSLQTELHRTMRLLETDMLFLQSSRQSLTRQSRLKMMSDRNQMMIRFCQEILKLNERD